MTVKDREPAKNAEATAIATMIFAAVGKSVERVMVTASVVNVQVNPCQS